MTPRIVPGALGRPVEQVMAAYAIAEAMLANEPDTSLAQPWLLGMSHAGAWVLGKTTISPLTTPSSPPTLEAVAVELITAGEMDLPTSSAPGSSDQAFARGVYRMLSYCLGLRDELPVRLSREVAMRLHGNSSVAA